jgi:hypothetical protein
MPDTHFCTYTAEPITPDGQLDEPAWELAEVLDFYVPPKADPVISKTEGRLLWDNKFLYAGYRAYDRDVWSTYTEPNSPTCHEDVLELFFMPDETEGTYYNFEINALGTVYDACNRRPYKAGGSGSQRWKQWNCENLGVGVHVEGKINDMTVEDEYWQLEIAVPFASLPTVPSPPQAGDKWRFHLARYDYSMYLPDGLELSTTARLPKVDFHLIETWDVLEFR